MIDSKSGTDAYILGGAQTDFARNWTREGKGLVAMMTEVVEDGLESLGLDYDEIERLQRENRLGIFVGNFNAGLYARQGHLGSFLTEVHPAFYGVPGARYEAACASGSVALNAARSRIVAGDYDVGIVLGIEIMKTVSARVGGDFLGTAAYYEKEAQGHDFPFPELFGRLADVILERASIPAERVMDCLAEISRVNYENAVLNPLAQTRDWYMSREHACLRGARFNAKVGGKLAVTDCSQVTDGAVFLLLSNETYAREYLKKKNGKPGGIARIKGWGHRTAPLRFDAKIEESREMDVILPWTRRAVLDACEKANTAPEDMDVFETHDCFTSSEYVALSAFGITPPGEEYRAIEEGVIQRNGKKPVNPGGGLIGIGHPVGASGARMALDLFKQVTERAGEVQIPGAKNGLMLNIGGSAVSNLTFVIGRAEE